MLTNPRFSQGAILRRLCSKIAEAEAAVSANEKKWLVMHMHVQLQLDELPEKASQFFTHHWPFIQAVTADLSQSDEWCRFYAAGFGYNAMHGQRRSQKCRCGGGGGIPYGRCRLPGSIRLMRMPSWLFPVGNGTWTRFLCQSGCGDCPVVLYSIRTWLTKSSTQKP